MGSLPGRGAGLAQTIGALAVGLLAIGAAAPAEAAGPFDGTYAYVSPGHQGTLTVFTTINGTVYFDLRTAATSGRGSCGATGTGVLEANRLRTQLPGASADMTINFFFQGEATVEVIGAEALCTPGGQLAGNYNKVSNDVALNRDQVRTIQARLNALGYAAGPVDGIVGSRTRRALTQYQQARGLPADGVPTLEMLVRLNQGL